MSNRIIILLAFLVVCTASCLPQDTFWNSQSVAEKMKAHLLEKGYSNFSTLDLVWILHQENPILSTRAAYLLGQAAEDRTFAESELVKELELWRD